MKLIKVCQLNGKTYEMDINCTSVQLELGKMLHERGALLQDAFFFLNADEREFVKTGTPPHVWDEMFGNDDEDLIGEVARSFDGRDEAAPDERAASDANDRHYGNGD